MIDIVEPWEAEAIELEYMMPLRELLGDLDNCPSALAFNIAREHLAYRSEACGWSLVWIMESIDAPISPYLDEYHVIEALAAAWERLASVESEEA